jgi:hypothetical protein
MARLPDDLRSSLVLLLASVAPDDGGRGVVEALLQWMAKCGNEVRTEPFLSYGFNSIADMTGRASEYPLADISEADVDRISSRASRLANASDEVIAQFVRDLMEELIAVEFDRVCCRCGETYMRAYIGVSRSLPAFQCDTCGYGEFLDGSSLSGESLKFISLKEMDAYGLHS